MTKHEKFLLQLQKNMEGGAVQPDELIEVIKVVLTVVKEANSVLESKIQELDLVSKDKASTIMKKVSEVELYMKSLDKTADIGEVLKNTQLLSQELALVKSQIPTIDISPLEEKINTSIIELEKKIPSLPKELTGEDIVRKINDLPTDDESYLINPEHIKDLKKLFETWARNLGLGRTVVVGSSVGGGGRSVRSYDIYSQLDGVTKTFTLPAVYRIISVHSSSFPYSFRETVDYTWTPTSITFTSEINAASTLAAGQTITIIYSEA